MTTISTLTTLTDSAKFDLFMQLTYAIFRYDENNRSIWDSLTLIIEKWYKQGYALAVHECSRELKQFITDEVVIKDFARLAVSLTEVRLAEKFQFTGEYDLKLLMIDQWCAETDVRLKVTK